MNENKWEIFFDQSYFGLYAVLPVGDADFDSPRLFHFTFKKDAEKFKELAEKSHHSSKVKE